jgi:hypothetical protein
MIRITPRIPSSWKLHLRAAGKRLTGRNPARLVHLYHPPVRCSRRNYDFTFNLPGCLDDIVSSARYRLNGGSWRSVGQGSPRAPAPEFVIELAVLDMRPGSNRLEIEALASGRAPEIGAWEFDYDPEPPRLPLVVDWSDPILEVEDGAWERWEQPNGSCRVRPVPGQEGYDRIVVAAGAFAGGRSIETDVVYRGHTGSTEWGFGLLPLWGGTLDEPEHFPRRGWLFSLSWYFNRYRGVGCEFSMRRGVEKARFCTSYRSLPLAADRPYRICVECRPEVDAQGNHLRYRQRLKWWAADEDPPAHWIELVDTTGWPLPERDYGVALVCYECQADFGPVLINSLPPTVAAD